MDEPLALDLGPDRDHVARCAACKHRLRTDASRALGLGPDCASKLGIIRRRRLRLTRAKPAGHCQGQTDLLGEDAVTSYITTEASDYYHAGSDCEAFQAGRRGSEAAGYQTHPVLDVTAEQAEAAGKTPCATCVTRA